MATRTGQRPDLLLFTPDQLRADAVAAFARPGSAVASTPVLDTLAGRLADPFESVNLAGRASHADHEERLRERLLGWLLDTADVLPPADEPRFPDIPHGWRTEEVGA